MKNLGRTQRADQKTTVFIHSPFQRNKLYPNVSGITRILILFLLVTKKILNQPHESYGDSLQPAAYKSKHLYNPILGGEEGMQE